MVALAVVFAVRLVGDPARTIVHHAAGHARGDSRYRVPKFDLAQCVNPPHGHDQVDRAASGERAAARVRAGLVDDDANAAPAEEHGEQGAHQTPADDRDPLHGNSRNTARTGLASKPSSLSGSAINSYCPGGTSRSTSPSRIAMSWRRNA